MTLIFALFYLPLIFSYGKPSALATGAFNTTILFSPPHPTFFFLLLKAKLKRLVHFRWKHRN